MPTDLTEQKMMVDALRGGVKDMLTNETMSKKLKRWLAETEAAEAARYGVKLTQEQLKGLTPEQRKKLGYE